MVIPDKSMQMVDPAAVLGQIAEAVPAECRDKIILIGSLAVGYHYKDQLDNMSSGLSREITEL